MSPSSYFGAHSAPRMPQGARPRSVQVRSRSLRALLPWACSAIALTGCRWGARHRPRLRCKRVVASRPCTSCRGTGSAGLICHAHCRRGRCTGGRGRGRARPSPAPLRSCAPARRCLRGRQGRRTRATSQTNRRCWVPSERRTSCPRSPALPAREGAICHPPLARPAAPGRRGGLPTPWSGVQHRCPRQSSACWAALCRVVMLSLPPSARHAIRRVQ
jgi:hypothetical protein